ncbi:hypothetical protein EDC04DRAFT_2910770 [Pisolithus marmoratus]|nr:hypothetical protein EDC04DRAFT_2910770 [Pisolithus marmoratus]
MLHSQFPQLIEVLDIQTKVANVNYNTRGMVGRQYKSLPPYLLCLLSHRDIVVAGGVELPDGELLFQKHSKGKGKHRAETDSSAEDTESQLWPKSDSHDDVNDPITEPNKSLFPQKALHSWLMTLILTLDSSLVYSQAP